MDFQANEHGNYTASTETHAYTITMNNPRNFAAKIKQLPTGDDQPLGEFTALRLAIMACDNHAKASEPAT